MVTRCASDVLTLSGFWDRVERGEVSLRLESDTYKDKGGVTRRRRPHPLILSGSPDVIGWSQGQTEWRAVGLSNHVGIPLLDAARAAGCSDPPDDWLVQRPTGHYDPTAPWTTDALLAIYQRLIDWWVRKGAGRWADTIGAAAWQWWRTTLQPKTVLEHDIEPVKAAERAAVYGGRAQMFWFGSAGEHGRSVQGSEHYSPAVPIHLDGPAYKYDVRSMYASLLAMRRFPTRYAHRLYPVDGTELRDACETMDLVATVRVRLQAPRLPHHSAEHGTTYPVGEWWTTLTTPELIPALDAGEVTGIGDVYAFRTGHPFREFARELMDERAGAINRGDKLGEIVCKGIANALGGRLARTYRGWTSIPGMYPMYAWGEWVESVGEGVACERYRGVAGMTQRYVTRDDRPGGLTAMYAHLTAYGRVMLHDIMATAGAGRVLMCDTDGLIVTAAGKDALAAAGHGHGDTPGSLRLVGEIGRFSGRTPKHYQADGRWTLAGARGDYGIIDRERVRCYLSCNPVRAGQRPDARGLHTAISTVEIDAIPLSGTPGADGWLIPPRVVDGAIVQDRPPRDDCGAALDT
jgi:hypothetical protein